MIPFSIAAVQMHISALESNTAAMFQKVEFIAEVYPWVQMILFSELAPFGPLTRNALPIPNPTEQAFCELAKKHSVWILPGSMFELADGVIYNTTPVINPDGVVVGRHRKLFPFLPYEQGVTAGTDFLVFDVPEVGRFGVSICYDMWFPETSRTLMLMGAEVLLHPSLTGTIDRDVELSIARATAAQNQMFVFDVNGLSAGGNGQSIVVAPTGEIMHQAGRAEEIVPIEIDLSRVRRSREVGLRGLGQPLKSFRDRTFEFPAYPKTPENQVFLSTLGPLQKPRRGSAAGLPEVEEREGGGATQ